MNFLEFGVDYYLTIFCVDYVEISGERFLLGDCTLVGTVLIEE